jgi:predicted cupin superfamily sugar epimerase
MNAQQVIKHLGLTPLVPEGGYFCQTYKSPSTVQVDGNTRSALTSIYYMLTDASFSAFHRLKSTEIYNYHQGAGAELILIDTASKMTRIILGANLNAGEVLKLLFHLAFGRLQE